MNRMPSVELVLRDYLADDGAPAPDHVLDTVSDLIRHQPQRPTWRLQGRTHVNGYLKVVIGLAAAAIIAVVGWQLLPERGGIGGQATPSPTILPTPSPSDGRTSLPVSCENDLTGCAGRLSAGDHNTENFTPGFGFTIPDGWGNWVALDVVYGLSTGPDRADPILVWSNVRPAEKDPSCNVIAAPGVGTSADDWINFLTSHPGLLTSNLHEVELDGAPAKVIDLAPNTSWTSPCASDRGNYHVAFIKSPNGPGDGYGVASQGRVRLYAIDLARETVIVTIYSYEGGDPAFATTIAEAEPIVATFDWACRPVPPSGPCWGPPDASGNPATRPPAS